MAHDEFTEKCLKFWTAAIAEMTGPNPPLTAKWHGVDAIYDALVPFMASSRNHAHLPRGGGMDLLSVDYASDPECLEFSVHESIIWLVRPQTLIFEYVPGSPINSFLLLELGPLLPTGVYENRGEYGEELLEVEPGQYHELGVRDQGFIGHDENGYEIPIPESSRRVCRWFGGKILIVSKRSVWNSFPDTYDGRHNRMKSEEIRTIIESILDGGTL